MDALTSQIVQVLQQRPNGPDTQDAIMLAGELIRTVTERGFKPAFTVVASANATQEDVDILQKTLIDFVENSPEATFLGSAIAVLGKTYDKNLVALYDKILHHQLKGLMSHNAAIYQCLVALDDLGEKVFSSPSSGAMSVESSIEAAQKRLKKSGIIVPW